VDRWERRLEAAARAREVAGTGADLERTPSGSLPAPGRDGPLAEVIAPEEHPLLQELIAVATRRPGFVARLPVRRIGAGDEPLVVEVAHEVLGAVLRIAGSEAGSPLAAATAPDLAAAPADRRTALERTQSAIDRADGEPVGMLLLDLDRFKLHNDTIGTTLGDEVLGIVAERVAACSAPAASVPLGGDEIAVIVDAPTTLARLEQLADEVRRRVAEPIRVGEHRLELSATVGVALATPGVTATDLLHNADSAMFAGKDRGRDRVEVFDRKLGSRRARQVSGSRELRRLLDDDGLELHYQPVVSLDTEMIVGAEALLRVRDADGGAGFGPSALVAVAEDVGLADRLGRFVVGRVAAQLAAWEPQLAPARRFVVSMNVTPLQLADPGAAERIRGALEQAGVSPARVAVELAGTSRVPLDVVSDAVIAELAAAGVAIGLDDVGTDASSLGAFRRLPLGFVKIDRAIVANLTADGGRADDAVVGATISLAHQLGLVAVAVGVERDEQRRALRRLGCDQAQGYWYSPPVPPDALADLLRTGTPLGG